MTSFLYTKLTRRIPYLNGARLGLFSADSVDTNAISRGTTVELSICVASLRSKKSIEDAGLGSMMAYEGDVCAISQVFHPSSSSLFQSRPKGVFKSPSPIFQPPFGGSVNLNDWISANGTSFGALDWGAELELMKWDYVGR